MRCDALPTYVTNFLCFLCGCVRKSTKPSLFAFLRNLQSNPALDSAPNEQSLFPERLTGAATCLPFSNQPLLMLRPVVFVRSSSESTAYPLAA